MKYVQRCMPLLALILIFTLAACGSPAATNEGAARPSAAASAGGEGAASPSTAASAGGEASPSDAPAASGDAAPSPTPEPTNGETSNYNSAATKFTFWIMPNGPQPIINAQKQ